MSQLEIEWLSKPVVERAKWYNGQIKKIYELLESENSFENVDIEMSQYYLTELKKKLKIDSKYGDSKQGPDIDSVEGQYYNYMIKASGKMRVRINSRPSQEWYSQLIDVEDEISEFLRFLEK